MTSRLWPYFLAAIPWLILLLRVRKSAPASRVPFPALGLLRTTTRQSRRRRAWRTILRAALRSVALLSLAFLWNHANRAPRPRLDAASAESAASMESATTKNATSILVVEGLNTAKEGRDPTGADYLELALEAQLGDVASIRRVAPLDFATRCDELLEDGDVVFFADFSSLSTTEADAVERFVSHGGKALVFPSAEIDETACAAIFTQWGLDVAVYDGALDKAPRVASTPLEKRFLDEFPARENSGIDALPIRRVVACYGEDATVALRDRASGAPLLSRLESGILWSSVGLDASFGALPGLEIFPAYLEEALKIAEFEPTAQIASREEDAALPWFALLVATFCELGVVVNYRDGTIMKTFGMIRRRTMLILKIRNA